MIKKITFITGNAGKAEQLGRYLGHPVAHLKRDLSEIQLLSLREIVEYKVRKVFSVVKGPVLVEDSSLVFKALGRLPGPLIKWFLSELDNEGLCRIVDRYETREAVASVVFGFYDGRELSMFEGEIEGSISETPRGERGFGWDPIFVPKGFRKTLGEMTVEEQRECSMRRIALSKLEGFLKKKKLGIGELERVGES